MIYFILKVISGVFFSIFYKISERIDCEPKRTLMAFFSVSAFFSFSYVMIFGEFNYDYRILLIAIITGLATFGAIISFLYLIKIGKFGLSWMLVNLSFSVPTLISIFVFGERPTISIYLALLLALVTLLLLFEIRRNEFRIKNIRTWTFLVLASMMLSGIADSGPKVIKEIAPGYAAMTFLSFNYLFALIPSIGFCIKRKEFPTRKEWLVGIGIGLSSLFSFLFLFLSLKTIPGTVVFPLSLTAVNVIVLLLSFIIWKERLNLKQVAGVFTAIIAAVLFNLNF